MLHLVLLGSLLTWPEISSKGEKLFAEGNFAEATTFYQQKLKGNAENPKIHYNLGTSLYKQRKWDDAGKHFQETLKTQDVNLQEKTYYNLGDSHYKQGEELLKQNPQEALKKWETGLKHFEQALSLNPKNEEAKFNYDLLKKLFEE